MIVGLMGKGSGSEQYRLAWLMRLWFYRRADRRWKARDSSPASVGVRKSESMPILLVYNYPSGALERDWKPDFDSGPSLLMLRR